MDRAAFVHHLVSRVQLQQQLERELLPTGIEHFDRMLEGLPRGAVTEIYGPVGSGKTSFVYAFLASATQSGEYCAYVDATSAFDPVSVAGTGANLRNLLWVRCSAPDQALKAADLLLHSGGWGVVVLDVADVSAAVMRRLPVSCWYRFRRAVERTPTIFLVIESEAYVRNCATMALELPSAGPVWSGSHRNFRLLRGANIRIWPRKPVRKEK